MNAHSYSDPEWEKYENCRLDVEPERKDGHMQTYVEFVAALEAELPPGADPVEYVLSMPEFTPVMAAWAHRYKDERNGGAIQ